MKNPLVSFVVAGMLGAGVTGCGESTSSENNTVSERINSFKAECEEKGGTAKVVDTCAGNNGCAGLNPDGTEHDCKGTASCDGAVWCEDASEGASSVEEVSSSSQVEVDPVAAYRTTCEADGKLVKESSSCKGTNSCKGLNPNGTEHDCAGMSECKGSLWCEENPLVTYRAACEADGKVVKESSSCKGTNSCKGLNPNGAEHDCAGMSECKGSLWCEEVA